MNFTELSLSRISRICKWSVECHFLNRPFSYSIKESQSNDTLPNSVEFSNMHNSDRSSNATRSSLTYKNL